jgi:hypothetical protein
VWSFGLYCGLLNIFFRFGMFRPEKSGNPAAVKGVHIAAERVEVVRPHQSIFEPFEKLLRKKMVA